MENKRGSSHVEIMISFVIFVGFLLFFYAVISPAIKGPRTDKTILEDVKGEILNYITGEVEKQELLITEMEKDPIDNCIKITNWERKNATVKLGETIFKSEYEIETKDIEGVPQTTYFLKIGDLSDSNLLEGFKVYFSNEFESKDKVICNKLISEYYNTIPADESYYTLNFKKKRNYIFESKINELNIAYEKNKDGLRDLLKIPDKYDFWFGFSDEEGYNLGVSSDEPTDIESENIYVDEIAISYIGSEEQDPENKKKGNLRIKIWG